MLSLRAPNVIRIYYRVLLSMEQKTLEYESSFSTDDFDSYVSISRKKAAWFDFVSSLLKWRIWFLLASRDIKLRYRRSVLGPFWLTLSMAITVYSMGYLYSYLFRIPLHEYFAYLVAGMLTWSLLSTTIIDLSDTFVLSEPMIKQIKLPYFLYIHRVIARNFLIFFHNILVMIPVMLFSHGESVPTFSLLFLIPGLLLIYLNATCYGIMLAMMSARYRDIPQVVKSLVQVIFFMTPIMWQPSILPESKRFIAMLNPFYSFIELVRAPLLGHLPSLFNLEMVFFVMFIGVLGSYWMFVSRRANIIYWL